jgi:ABC-type uncharacterized transport system involved in gliding motility auxiliary subunit/ABC-type transport system involved in multi-copper enzyme maturation permease subunit
MSQISPVFKREFLGYFRTPVAYVFLVIFLWASVGLAFFVGNFFKANLASLESYFLFHPWLFVLFAAAIGMRLWSEEKRTGTIELQFTLPITTTQAVLGKFLAAWAFFALSILLSFPLVMTVGFLGSPDWGVIGASYLGSILMAGAYLGVASLTSALTKNQVVSFVLSVFVNLVLVFLGWSVFNDALAAIFPQGLVDLLANFSYTTHFDSFTKGIIDPKDLVFFLSLAGFTLFLTVVALERLSLRAARRSLAVALLFLGLVLVNYLAAYVPLRIDATNDRIYTLSAGTKALLGKVEEPVTLDFYFSKSAKGVPVAYKNFAARVEEMLRQYVRTSKGRITLNLVEPKADTPEEERATAAGLLPQRLQDGESLYFGLVAVQADQQKIIASFNPQRESFLEYDLSQLVYSVQQVNKKKLGLISSLPLKAPMDMMAMQQGRMPQNQYVLGEWERSFEILSIEPSATELPAGLDVLAIVHPQALPAKLQYAIDQFLLSGKPVFIAVDPSSMYFKRQSGQMGMMGGQQPNASSDLPVLFKAYGINYNSSLVVGDSLNSTKVQTGAGSISPYPIWLSLGREEMNDKNTTTAQLDSLLFIEAGSLSANKDSGLSFVPLVQSSEQGGELQTSAIQFAQPEELSRQLVPSGKKTLAAIVTGKFKSAFPEGAPKELEAKKDEADAKSASKPLAQGLKESAGTSTLIVVADTDWLLDDYSVRRLNFLGVQAAEPLNDNLSLAANSIDFLGGSQDLVSIRGKGNSLRPFTVVKRMEAEAQKEYQEQLASVEGKLKEVQSKLNELHVKKGETRSLVSSPEIQKAVEDYQKQEAQARRERREIRRALREDIDALENELLLINLIVAPLGVAVFGVWFMRRRRN